MTFQMKTMEGVHSNPLDICCLALCGYMFCVFWELTESLFTVLLGVSSTSASKGKGPV